MRRSRNNRLELVLIVSVAIWFLDGNFFVKAQWILDHRCDHNRRRLGSNNTSSTTNNIIMNSHKELEEPDPTPPHRRFDDAINDAARNRNTNQMENEKTQQQHWYHNLRGRRHSSPEVNQQQNRQLVKEDPNSFMMRLHWQEGSCWQGK